MELMPHDQHGQDHFKPSSLQGPITTSVCTSKPNLKLLVQGLTSISVFTRKTHLKLHTTRFTFWSSFQLRKPHTPHRIDCDVYNHSAFNRESHTHLTEPTVRCIIIQLSIENATHTSRNQT